MAANIFGRYVWLIDSYTAMNLAQADAEFCQESYVLL